MPFSPILVLLLIVVLYLVSSIKILAEYERGVIFRLGKLLPRPKGPGVILVFAPIDRIVRVGLRTVVFDVPPLWAKVVILLAALPVGVNVYVFATRYEAGQAESAAAIVLSNLLSVVTLPLVLLWLGAGG